MTPVQRIAMGLVIVFGVADFPAHPHPAWQVYDGLADPVGWLLALSGLFAVVRLHPELDTLKWTGVLAAAVSVPMWFPQLSHHLDASGAWAALLPENLTCLLLCREIGKLGALQDPRDGYVAKRFGLLAWGFVVVTLLPVVIEGGRLTGLDLMADTVKYAVVIATVFYLFMVHRRTYLAGPGPRDYTQAVADARAPYLNRRSGPSGQKTASSPGAAVARGKKAAPRDGERPSKQSSVRRRRR